MIYLYENILKKNIYISNKINNLLKIKEKWFLIPDWFIIKYEQNIKIDIEILNIDQYIIRSCSNIEDWQKNSFAWLYSSLIFQNKKNNFNSNLLKTYNSIDFENINLYKNHFNIKQKEDIYFLVQEFIYWEYSWVYFSNYDWKELIEYVKSVNSLLVDWKVKSSKIIIENNNVNILNNIQEFYLNKNWKKIIYNKKTILKKKLLNKLLLEFWKIKIFFDFDVDIEWTIRNWDIFILQIRPITI